MVTIWAGHTFVTQDFVLFGEIAGGTARAKVLEVIDRTVTEETVGGSALFQITTLQLRCKFETGPLKGQTVQVKQVIDEMNAGSTYVKEAQAGDQVNLFNPDPGKPLESAWEFSDYYRLDKIMILGFVFAGLLILVGGRKGINTILSMCFTVLFIFLVFVPSVMNGFNAYVSSVATCIYTIVMTLILINGASRKTLATITGCISGTAIAALTTSFMSSSLRLTGFVDEHSIYLIMMNPDKPVDLTAIIFAAIIIGAMGAIMDVAMDLASALSELCEHVPDISFKKLFRSGMRIGSDIMGTMANTLVLAYIGSSLCAIMLYLTYSSSLMDLLNREAIIIELLQALTGSMAIVLTIPFTVVVCGLLYLKHDGKTPSRRKPLPGEASSNDDVAFGG